MILKIMDNRLNCGKGIRWIIVLSALQYGLHYTTTWSIHAEDDMVCNVWRG